MDLNGMEQKKNAYAVPGMQSTTHSDGFDCRGTELKIHEKANCRDT